MRSGFLTVCTRMHLAALLACAVVANVAQAAEHMHAEQGHRHVADADQADWARKLGLPPVAPTRDVIAALPQVLAARAVMDVALAREQSLQTGAHEWTLRVGGQVRSESTAAASNKYYENDVALERNFRWRGKQQTDAELGAAGVSVSRSAYADNWHETIRGLLQGWFDWQRARSAARVQAEQTALAQQQLDIAARRVKAGDVARLDELMAQAERDRQQAQQAQAQGLQAVLESELRKRFPGLALEAAAAGESSPQGLHAAVQMPAGPERWVQRILDDNHEIELAEAQARVARLRSDRAGLDRYADPLLGVRSARERGGADNIVGIYIGIPLTGSYRASEQKAALAEAMAAEQRVTQTRQRVEAMAQRVVLRATHALTTWQRLTEVAQATTRVSELGLKAYSLGEMTLTEALQARRFALDAALAAESARWDALEAVSRLLVDGHQLWPADEGGH